MTRRRKPTKQAARIKIATYRASAWPERLDYLDRTDSTRTPYPHRRFTESQGDPK